MPTGPQQEFSAVGFKQFSDADQEWFAELSGDVNPMHVDAVAARRLMAGRQVVHGIHAVMYALEFWKQDSPSTSLQISVSFKNPICLGDSVEYQQVDSPGGRSRVRAFAKGLLCAEVQIERLSEIVEHREVLDEASTQSDDLGSHVPLDCPPALQVGRAWRLKPADFALQARFPRASAHLGEGGIRALARLSFFVGMVCPGLHSVFSSVRFSTHGSRTGILVARVASYDPRFALFRVDFSGALRGELRAFRRPPPMEQPSAQEIATSVRATEFQGTRALVVGGSRGLGETTAKIICAGGGDVWVTYATGHGDAEKVATDIETMGRGRCRIFQLQLDRDVDIPSTVDIAAIDSVYYFATPRIFSKRARLFDRSAFDAFAGFYLERFFDLCERFEQSERQYPVKVYLPSTVFLVDRPKGMVEYAMAKAAAEILATEISTRFDRVEVVTTRLPRLATDQTASISTIDVEPTVATLLEVVRRMTKSDA